MTVQQSTVPPILLQALPEEVFFIDEAAGNYILSLERKSLIVDEDEEVLALMKAFRQRDQGFLADGSGRRGALTRSRKRRATTGALSLLGGRGARCEPGDFVEPASADRQLFKAEDIT